MGDSLAKPLVSIVIPVFNGADYLAQAIDSALGRPVRYIVVAPRAVVARNGARGATEQLLLEPWWSDLLRLASGMTPKGH